MYFYWYKLFTNHTHASIIGGSLSVQFYEVNGKICEMEVYETKRGKYGIRFKIAIS
ncbi:hypothetical protein D3C86_2193080 [compost metagenome]